MEAIVRDLIELQRIDWRIASLSGFMDELPSLRGALAAERAEAEAEVSAEREKLDLARENLRKKERELADGEEKLKQIQARLNQVKTNKEYDAALAEIAKQKGVNSDIESEILMLYDEVEESEGKKAELEGTWQARDRVFKEKEKALEDKAAQKSAELLEKQAEREKLVAEIDKKSLELYEKITRASGTAVANARSEVCLGCNTKIPAQLYNLVLKGETICQCAQCHRILVHPEAVVFVDEDDEDGTEAEEGEDSGS